MRWFRGMIVLGVVLLAGLVPAPLATAQTVVRPLADGTLVDGGIYGDFDGVPDDWDWAFDDSGYDGAITFATETPETSLEHRVVWEYSLWGLSYSPPVSATLTFTIRGAPVFPIPDAVVHVYSYPADVAESSDDFAAGPAVLQGSVILASYQPPTEFTLDVSSVVNEAMLGSLNRVAFRFQINPDTPHNRNQAFIDALDDEPSTKPFLTIDEAQLPGDSDGDGDVDLADYSTFFDCMEGPAIPFDTGCDVFDFDQQGDVDLRDFATFQQAFMASGK